MPSLDKTATLDRKRLLELFPVTIIRSTWSEIKGSKSDICSSVAESRKPEDLLKFVAHNLSVCKQHVFVFERSDKTVLPKELLGTEGYFPDAETGIYIIRTTFTTLLREPAEETTIDFLWPVAIQLKGKYLVLRLVSLEKNLSSYFERPCYVAGRSIEERDVLKEINGHTAGITDIHKGIKKLWQEAAIDSPRAKFKKPKSMASEAMDEELGIREHNPELYEVLAESVLLNALFTVSDQEKMGVSHFSMNFTEGYLAFPSYSTEGGRTMSLRQFLSAIAEKLRIDPLAGKEAQISKLDPEKIYLENVRSVLGVSTFQAKLYCETAVRRGVFCKRVEVVCPDGSVAVTAKNEADLPEVVKCWQEDGGEFTQVEYATRDLRKVSFYQMNYDGSASRAHA